MMMVVMLRKVFETWQIGITIEFEKFTSVNHVLPTKAQHLRSYRLSKPSRTFCSASEEYSFQRKCQNIQNFDELWRVGLMKYLCGCLSRIKSAAASVVGLCVMSGGFVDEDFAGGS